jgi:hypothetical protein
MYHHKSNEVFLVRDPVLDVIAYEREQNRVVWGLAGLLSIILLVTLLGGHMIR